MDPRSTRLDDLELSSMTAAWVRSLGVSTVGELLALPSLSPPDAFVEEEIAAHLDDLGLRYDGDLVEA